MDMAIVAIGYNRPDSLARLLSYLAAADYCGDEVTLYISLDKGARQAELIKLAEEFDWKFGPKSVRAFSQRQGLKSHVLQCGDLVEKHDAIIALEDDIIVSPYFYHYAKQAVAFYGDDSRIAGISLYKCQLQPFTNRLFEPVYNGCDCFFMREAQSWGQCWTKGQWLSFRAWLKENDLKITFNAAVPPHVIYWDDAGSWLRYYMYYTAVEGKYFVYPYVSLTSCGADKGSHVEEKINCYQAPLCYGKIEYKFPRLEEGIKYDCFFEREFEAAPRCIPQGKSYAVDLYGLKENLTDYDYALSTKLLNYKIVRSFGYERRPIEVNVTEQTEGTDIFLYDMRLPEKHKYTKKQRLIHEMRAYYYDIREELGPKKSLKLAIALMLKARGRGKKKK